MARGPSRPWKRLAPHTEAAFPFVRAAMASGYGIELVIADVSGDTYVEVRRGLFNAAKHEGVSLHCHPKKQADGTYTLTYAVHRKADGRAHHLQKNGTDRTSWPYNPRRPSPRNEEGQRVDV